MATSKTVGRDLTEGPILSTLAAFAGPIILTNLIQQLYALVDLIVIGQFVGKVGTVGVSTGGEMADLVTPVATSFATAGQIYIAQLAGARDQGRLRSSAGTLITLMIILSLALSAVAILFCTPILRLLNCPEEALHEAQAYMLSPRSATPLFSPTTRSVAFCAVWGSRGAPCSLSSSRPRSTSF